MGCCGRGHGSNNHNNGCGDGRRNISSWIIIITILMAIYYLVR